MLVNLLKELLKNLEDEICGIKKYLSLAHSAEMSGLDEFALYLYRMSQDEYKHAWFIAESCAKQGIEVDHECWVKLKEYRAILENL
jgi:ferritin